MPHVLDVEPLCPTDKIGSGLREQEYAMCQILLGTRMIRGVGIQINKFTFAKPTLNWRDAAAITNITKNHVPEYTNDEFHRQYDESPINIKAFYSQLGITINGVQIDGLSGKQKSYLYNVVHNMQYKSTQREYRDTALSYNNQGPEAFIMAVQNKCTEIPGRRREASTISNLTRPISSGGTRERSSVSEVQGDGNERVGGGGYFTGIVNAMSRMVYLRR